MRTSLLRCGAAALVAGPTLIAFFSGGFFDRPRLIAGIAAWAIVILVALLAPRPLLPTSTPGLMALGGLFLLTVLTAVSISWAPLGGRAEDDAQRLLLYLGFFFAALVLLRERSLRRGIEPALALGVFVVVCYALSARLVPWLVEQVHSKSAGGRLEQPVSYWNALGLLAAMGLLLTIRIAGDPSRDRLLRAGAAAAGVPIGLAVYLTYARGALAAFAAGALMLVALAPHGRPQVRALVAIVGASALAALLATRLPEVRSLAAGEQGDSVQGAGMLAGLVVLALVAAAVVWLPPRGRIPVPELRLSRPRTVLLGTALALVVGAFVVAVLEGKPEGTSPVVNADPARLGSVDTNRYRYWDVAVETWADHPLAGVGSGGFMVEWLKQRNRVDTSGDAHSLYLETAAELGAIGLAVLVLFVVGVIMGVTRLYRVDPAAATGPAAVLAAFAVHSGLDWDWEMPAVTLLALLVAAAAIAWSEEGREARHEASFTALSQARPTEAAVSAATNGGRAAERQT